MIDLDFSRIDKGDFITLEDWKTLEAMGEATTFEITENHKWCVQEGITFYGYEMEVNDDVTIMLVIRDIKGTLDYRIFQKWEDGVMGVFEPQCIICDDGKYSFIDFDEYTDNDDKVDEVCPYIVKDGYPFWGVETDEHKVALCEYIIAEEDCDEYWAKHCFVEWFDENDEEGYMSMWFGWDITEDDFKILDK